jgi:hypothetical protein
MAEYQNGERLIFPEKTLNSNGDTIKLVLVFGNDAMTGITDIKADRVGLGVVNYGEAGLEYSLDESLITISGYKFTIFDRDGYLLERIFNITLWNHVYTYENAYHQLEVYLYINGTLEFFGLTREDATEYERGTRLFTFTANSPLDKVNELALYDDDDNAINPLGLDLNRNYYLLDIIGAIYQKGYSAATLNWRHGWDFYAPDISGYGDLSHITVKSMDYFTGRSGKNFYSGNLGDWLRTIARHLGAITGLMGGTAFFYNIYDFANIDLQPVKVLSHKLVYAVNKLRYIHIIPDAPNVSGEFTAGQVEQSGIESATYKEPEMPAYFQPTIDNDFAPLQFSLDCDGTCNNPDTRIIAAKGEPFQPTYEYHPQTLGSYLWYFRGRVLRNRVDEFIFDGIDYDFLKNFEAAGQMFQIISMKKKFADNQTEVKALLLS